MCYYNVQVCVSGLEEYMQGTPTSKGTLDEGGSYCGVLITLLNS